MTSADDGHDPSEPRELIEILAEEFVERCRAGERPDVAEYTRQHPELADSILGLFPTLRMLEEAGDSSAEGAPPLPERIGEYAIVRELGRGGMGVVYEARQESLGRRVALKLLPPQATIDPVFLERFRLEAQAAGRLQHGGIVPVFGVGEVDGVHYYTMQYIDGHGLDEVVREVRCLRRGDEPPPPPMSDVLRRLLHEELSSGSSSVFTRAAVEVSDSGEVAAPSSTPRSRPGRFGRDPYSRNAAHLALQVSEALAYAHGQGILHRDIKPSNLLLDSRGKVWITDFGLCKAEGSASLTQTGGIVGTLRYMAPESFQGLSDVRSDVYGVGITLYELLTTRPAYPDGDRATLLRKVTQDTVPRPRSIDPTIPADLEAIVLKATAREPRERYATADALSQDLRAYLEDRPIAARVPGVGYALKLALRRHRGVAVTALAALLVIVAMTGFFVARLQKRYGEIIRLADLKRLSTARLLAAELWPPTPDRVEALTRWLEDRAHPLRERLASHERILERLRRRALPYDDEQRTHDRETHPAYRELTQHQERVTDLERQIDHQKSLAAREGTSVEPAEPTRTEQLEMSLAEIAGRVAELETVVAERRTWKFAADENQWWHDTLADLVAELRRFDDPERGALASVEERLDFARTVAERSLLGEEAAPRWRQAIEDIAGLEVYGGLELKPQLGLLPLRRDPRSGLWEFWHLQSGARPELAGDPAARSPWIIARETGVVLVLIPGGEFWRGAETPRLGVIPEPTDRGVLVKEVVEGSLAHRLGVAVDDVIVAVNGQPTVDRDSIARALAGLGAGAPVTMTLDRGGASLTLAGALGPNVDPAAESNEGPIERVYVAPYFISKYEMTQGQWERIAKENPSQYGPDWIWQGNQNTWSNPVERVSWRDCDRIFHRLGLVLPTGDQWERAARAGTVTPFWCGAALQSIQETQAGNLADAWTKQRRGPTNWVYEDWLEDGWGVHAPVGSFTPNPFGLHDTLGNVSEWCRNAFGDVPGSRFCVTRGGGFLDNVKFARSADRNGVSPDAQGESLGVRAGREVDE